MELEVLSLGQHRPEWVTFSNAFILEYDQSTGFILNCFFNDISPIELKAFDVSSPLEIRMKEIQDTLFFCFKFGGMPWGDCSFSPTLYKPVPTFNEIPQNEGYALTILVIDSLYGELKYIRVLALNHDFSIAVLENCKSKIANPITPAEHKRIVEKVYATYSSEQLAEIVGKNVNEKMIV